MYNKGCDQGDACTTRDPLPWPATVRQLSLCSESFADPSLPSLLRCVILLAVFEHEADDELKAVGILRGQKRKTRPQPRRSTVVLIVVCVCVFFPFILDIKFVGRTSRGHTGGRSHRISHPPSFCGACLNFYREKDSAIPFPRRP